MRISIDERGMATLPTVVAVSLSLVAFVLLANLVLIQYARGVARTAADEAVRQAVVDDSVDRCTVAAEQVLADLLGGGFGSGLVVSCADDGSAMQASVTGLLPALLPLVPDARVRAVARSRTDVP